MLLSNQSYCCLWHWLLSALELPPVTWLQWLTGLVI